MKHQKNKHDLGQLDGDGQDNTVEEQDSPNRGKYYDKAERKHGRSDHQEQLNIADQNEKMEEKEDEIARA